MAYSYATNLGDGFTNVFTIPFSYLDRSHVGVKVGGITAAFTWLTDYTIKILPAPVGVVEIRRVTPKDTPPVDFSDGSVLKEQELDLLAKFSLYCAQEAYDTAQDAVAQSSLGISLGKVYQGTLSVNPTVRVDGTALAVGDMYFNSVTLSLRIYTGLLWQEAGATVPGILNKPSTPVLATAGQTVVPVPQGYDPTGIVVFLNGSQVAPPDVTVTSGTNIVFTTPLALNDEVSWLAFGVFQIANVVNPLELASSIGASMVGFKHPSPLGKLRTIQDRDQDELNVLDFMTAAEKADVRAGTFLVDVTVACQSALSWAASTTLSGLTTSGSLATSYTGTSVRVKFPRGGYRISAALVVGAYVEIDGDSAIIKQFTDTEDIFSIQGYLVSIYGMQFVGGRTHIDLYNANINSTMIDIERCQFFLSRSYALNFRATGVYTHLSASGSVTKCRFIACNMTASNACDQLNFKGCWFQPSKTNMTASTAQFVNKGLSVGDPDALTRIHFEDSFFIPDVGTEGVDRVNNVRWCDNSGSFSANNCRFGGEFGGMSIVWHLGSPNTAFPWTSQEISLTNCFLFAGPDARTDSCVIGIQGAVPNRITVRNCTGPLGRPIIANLSSLAIPAFMTAYETASSRKAIEWFKIDIRDVEFDINAYSGRSIIPNDLYKYLINGRQTVVSRVASQSISNAFALNLVSFDTIVSDNVRAFDIANPTLLVMPRGARKMRVTVNLRMAVDGAAKTIAATLVATSGTTRVGGNTQLRGINADSDRISFSVEVEGDAGTTWSVAIQHNAAAALNLLDCTVALTPLDLIA